MLTWHKPEQTMSKEQWKSISADAAPPGVYVPNMSTEDARKWKAKFVGKKGGIKQVEIRKTTANGTQMLLIVSNGGFRNHRESGNIRLSLNGPAAFTFEEMQQMQQAIAEARDVLDAS